MQRRETSWSLRTCYLAERPRTWACKFSGTLGTLLEHSLAGESQASSRAERAVRTFEELLTVQKLALETKIGEMISAQHSVFLLLIEFGTTVINRRLVGKDGRTAYEHTKQNLHMGEVLPFGLQATLGVGGKVERCVMVERWFTGVRLEAVELGRTIGYTKLQMILLHGQGS